MNIQNVHVYKIEKDLKKCVIIDYVNKCKHKQMKNT